MKITQAVPAMFAALAALTMKTIMTSHSRPLAGLSGLFTPKRKPAKSEMSVALGMIPRLLDRMASLLRILSAGALLGCASSAVANPISVSDIALRIDDTGPNDIGINSGEPSERILISAEVTPTVGTMATAQPINLSILPIPLPFFPTTVNPNEFITSILYGSNLTGPWTLTFTDDGDTTTVPQPPTTLSLVGVTPAPFANSVMVSGSWLNPTFTWSYPTNVDGVAVQIYDKSSLINGHVNVVFYRPLPGAMNMFTLPTVLAGGFTLTPGTYYVVDLKGLVLRNPAGPLTLANTASLTEAFFDFTPTSAGIQPPIYLPTIDSNGVYHFNLTVQPNTTYYIDPTVATGFIYTIGAGNPNFATVVLPTLQGAAPYTITWDNGLHTEQVLGGHVCNLPRCGGQYLHGQGHRPSRRP